MATVVPVTTFPFETSRDVAVTTWDNMLMDDDGEPVRLAVYSDRSIQVAGTFGGASVTIGGSNDGETYHALHDTSGAVMTLTEGKLQQIVELPIYIKPRVFGQQATLARNRALTAQGGDYTYVGQDATLLRSKLLTASGGSYLYTGRPITFTYASLYPDPADVTLGVTYGPGGVYVGTKTGGTGMIWLRRR